MRLRTRIALIAVIGVAWVASLPLNAFGMSGGGPTRWYPGLSMFVFGLIGQWMILPSLFQDPAPIIAWWANVALAVVTCRLLLNQLPGFVWSVAPLAKALPAFTIKTWALPDDSDLPVTAYGAGFWLWLAVMAAPLATYALRLAVGSRTNRQPPPQMSA